MSSGGGLGCDLVGILYCNYYYLIEIFFPINLIKGEAGLPGINGFDGPPGKRGKPGPKGIKGLPAVFDNSIGEIQPGDKVSQFFFL